MRALCRQWHRLKLKGNDKIIKRTWDKLYELLNVKVYDNRKYYMWWTINEFSIRTTSSALGRNGATIERWKLKSFWDEPAPKHAIS